MPREAEKIDYEIMHHLPNLLGECPTWDERKGWLYWVDIKARQILSHDPIREITESRDVPGRPIPVSRVRSMEVFSFGRVVNPSGKSRALWEWATEWLLRKIEKPSGMPTPMHVPSGNAG